MPSRIKSVGWVEHDNVYKITKSVCGNLKRKNSCGNINIGVWNRKNERFGRFWIKISVFRSKNELLSVFDSTRFGPHFWSRDVCVRVYLYAVLYLDQETSSESKHMFSHLLDGYHEFIFIIFWSFLWQIVLIYCVKLNLFVISTNECVFNARFCFWMIQKEEKGGFCCWKWDTKLVVKYNQGVCEIMWVCWIGVRCVVQWI